MSHHFFLPLPSESLHFTRYFIVAETKTAIYGSNRLFLYGLRRMLAKAHAQSFHKAKASPQTTE